MDWKDFFKPSWKKAGVFVLAYILLMPIILCVMPGRTSSGGSGSSCGSIMNNIIANPIQYLVFITIGAPIAVSSGNPWAVIFFPTGILISYLLACLLMHYFQQKLPLRKKKK